MLDNLKERETYTMLSLSVAQAPIALVTFKSSACFKDRSKKPMNPGVEVLVIKHCMCVARENSTCLVCSSEQVN